MPLQTLFHILIGFGIGFATAVWWENRDPSNASNSSSDGSIDEE